MNFIKILPVAFCWAVVWFALAVVDVITSKRKENSNRDNSEALNFENATRTLASDDSTFSWIGLGIDMLKKLVRMVVFLSLPAICWKQKGAFSGFKEALKTIRKHPVEFLSGYFTTGVVSILVFLPIAIPLYLDAKEVFEIPNHWWPGIFIYISAAWSFSIYIEQMFMAELYLWHLNWTEACSLADGEGVERPSLSDVRKPSLLDDICDFMPTSPNQNPTHDKKESTESSTDPTVVSINKPIHQLCPFCGHKQVLENKEEVLSRDSNDDSESGAQIKCASCNQVSDFKIQRSA